MSHKLNARTWHVPQKSTVQTVYPVPRGILQNLGPHDEGKNTYVVIVNKGEAADTSCDIQTLKPCFRLKKGLPKVRLKMESHVDSEYDSVDSNSAPLGSKNVSDDVRLNLTDMGFEDYDSTASAQNVFSDYYLDENQALDLTNKNKSTKLKISQNRPYKSSSDDKNQENNDPFLSPIPGSFQILKPGSTATPVGTRMDLSGSSGYNSACSPYLQSNFETPSPIGGGGGGCGTSSNKQSAARQIFLISPSNVQGDGASPISCLSAGLKHVAVLQSPSETAAPTSKTYQLGNYNYSTANASEVPTVAINPSFLTSTPITQTLTSSQTETLTSVKPFNVKLPILKRGAASSSPTMKMCDLEKKSENNYCDNSRTKVESYGNMVMHFDCKPSENIVKIEFDTSLKEENESVSVAAISNPGSTAVLSSSQEFIPRSLQSESVPSSSQESVESQDSAATTEKESLDDSLTNMQWLRGIKLKKNEKEEKPESSSSKSKDKDISSNSIQWRYLSPADIKKISQECGKNKRPPFSYMSLIQMALNSTEEKKMTLREICKWIETTFMYYKSTAKPGWKNSIRHNLSLYSIFEREKSKKHGSYWTMKEDCPEKAKVTPSNKDKKGTNYCIVTVKTFFLLL
ncbi:hypothetical protein KUTeg_023195 [Tegillarca granosa]|uniref:Fork-head domain-containing protein n=1 Tax=Tegillarca granosa TaxID=220873 RepID=A0ABQ9E1Y1_TEGGR|nr:hypothetical protein KUTeg_023195 [Tegillarca granosa]